MGERVKVQGQISARDKYTVSYNWQQWKIRHKRRWKRFCLLLSVVYHKAMKANIKIVQVYMCAFRLSKRLIFWLDVSRLIPSLRALAMPPLLSWFHVSGGFHCFAFPGLVKKVLPTRCLCLFDCLSPYVPVLSHLLEEVYQVDVRQEPWVCNRCRIKTWGKVNGEATSSGTKEMSRRVQKDALGPVSDEPSSGGMYESKYQSWKRLRYIYTNNISK